MKHTRHTKKRKFKSYLFSCYITNKAKVALCILKESLISTMFILRSLLGQLVYVTLKISKLYLSKRLELILILQHKVVSGLRNNIKGYELIFFHIYICTYFSESGLKKVSATTQILEKMTVFCLSSIPVGSLSFIQRRWVCWHFFSLVFLNSVLFRSGRLFSVHFTVQTNRS